LKIFPRHRHTIPVLNHDPPPGLSGSRLVSQPGVTGT
jgi:hypothetical protein